MPDGFRAIPVNELVDGMERGNAKVEPRITSATPNSGVLAESPEKVQQENCPISFFQLSKSPLVYDLEICGQMLLH
jgi:hypothetical protein